MSDLRVRRFLFSKHSNFYLKEVSQCNGHCLMIGLDVPTRQHKAFGSLSTQHQIIVLERKEEEAREFLLSLRPLLRKLWNTINNMKFLRVFTFIYPVMWNEVEDLVMGDLSLRTVTLEGVRKLPPSYLKKYSSANLSSFINHSRIITRRK